MRPPNTPEQAHAVTEAVGGDDDRPDDAIVELENVGEVSLVDLGHMVFRSTGRPYNGKRSSPG